MGQALKRATRMSVTEEIGGMLQMTPINEEMLRIIISFIEELPSKYPEETKLVFKKPLTWDTSLTFEAFSGDDYVISENELKSKMETENPLLLMTKSRERNILSIQSLEVANKVLRAAGLNKLQETWTCLSTNTDPVASILGDRFAVVDHLDTSLIRLCNEIIRDVKHTKQQADVAGDSAENNDKTKLLYLYILLMQLDERLLNLFIVKYAEEVRLTPEIVDRELVILRNLAQRDMTNQALESIDFYDHNIEYVYMTGCRAPLSRQVHGDICYLKIKILEGNEVYVTANSNGYFVINGPKEADGSLDYEKKGEYFKNLVSLLSSLSPKFAEQIAKLKFNLNPSNDEEKPTAVSKNDQVTEDSKKESEVNHATDKKKQERDKKKKPDSKHNFQPSMRWQIFEEKDSKEKPETKKNVSRLQTSTTGKGKKRIPDDSEESFSESSTDSEEEEEIIDRRGEANADLPTEYWQLQKLVKYLKVSNQTATVIFLCCMRDFNLSQETCQLAIRDLGGLELLINLLETDEIKCKIGALKILKDISSNNQIRRSIADLGGLQTMVKILQENNKEQKCLAAETIANVAKFQRARRTVRQHGGIKMLVKLLNCSVLAGDHPQNIEKEIEIARCGALALWSLSKSRKNKEYMRRAGAIPLLAKLLKSTHENMLVPIVGTLQECASEPSYRVAIRTEGMIEDLVKNLKSQNEELVMYCAFAIFKCAEDKETRDLVREFSGLAPLVAILSSGNKELLAAATGAIWKCAISRENLVQFRELKTIEQLVGLLGNQPEKVLINVVGALGELARDPPNRQTIRKSGGITQLVNLLTGTNQALLINVTRAVGQCAEEVDSMGIIEHLDGVRLLWSLLKNPNPEVISSAAWAICPCIENAKDAGEMVRSFVGGLELIVNLLKSDNIEVLASVCAAIAKIAKDEENLAVITDHNVVPMLAHLTNTTNDRLRQHLAEAIARCCNWGHNRVSFGNHSAVAPLVKYLQSRDEKVHRSTARALYQLSKNANNCIIMYEAGVVKPLMKMVGSTDIHLQEAAAGCIGNIRSLALANASRVK